MNSMFRLQYASNLFVDLHKLSFEKLVKPGCANLALLGNIGKPEHSKTYHFLKYCARNWDNVYWIPGPHELTNSKGGSATFTEKILSAHTLTKNYSNVRLFDNQEAVYHKDRVVLLGSPLWTHVNLPSKGQPEFTSIFTSVDESGPIPLCHHVRNKLHKEDSHFLAERSLFWSIVHPDVNLVYLTHTLPSPLLLTPPISDEFMKRYTLDVMTVKMGSPLKAWIGGSTGCTHAVRIGSDPEEQVQVAVNSMFPYPFEHKPNQNYDVTKILTITPKKPFGTAPSYLPRLILPPLLSSLCRT
jgi:hypothetical protein